MEHDPKLEAGLHQQLRALPDLHAPGTLIPHVLAALQARAALPWWQRPWSQWPQRAQLASCGWLAVVAAVLYWGVKGWDGVPEWSSTETGSFGLLTNLWSVALSLVQAAGTFAGAFQPVLITGAVLSFLAYLACLGIGSACLRAALQKGGPQ